MITTDPSRNNRRGNSPVNRAGNSPENYSVCGSDDSVPNRFLRKRDLAEIISVSERTIANLISRRIIPQIRLSARLTRFSLPEVLAALGRYEIKEIGGR